MGMSRRMEWRGTKMEKRQYKCEISGRVCPFNDDIWELGGADDIASDNCPIQSYENSNQTTETVRRISDWCKHLIPR